MASFSFNGLDTIEASFRQLAELTADDTYSVLQPAAELLKKAYEQTLRTLFTVRSGALAVSIEAERTDTNGSCKITLSPKGNHPGSSTGKRKKKGKSSGKYSGTNAEVAFILEFGSPRIKPRWWMQTTNDQQEEAVLAAQQAAWDALLAQKGL